MASESMVGVSMGGLAKVVDDGSMIRCLRDRSLPASFFLCLVDGLLKPLDRVCEYAMLPKLRVFSQLPSSRFYHTLAMDPMAHPPKAYRGKLRVESHGRYSSRYLDDWLKMRCSRRPY